MNINQYPAAQGIAWIKSTMRIAWSQIWLWLPIMLIIQLININPSLPNTTNKFNFLTLFLTPWLLRLSKTIWHNYYRIHNSQQHLMHEKGDNGKNYWATVGLLFLSGILAILGLIAFIIVVFVLAKILFLPNDVNMQTIQQTIELSSKGLNNINNQTWFMSLILFALPLLIALAIFWTYVLMFSAQLVDFKGYRYLEALKTSFSAVWKNIKPLLCMNLIFISGIILLSLLSFTSPIIISIITIIGSGLSFILYNLTWQDILNKNNTDSIVEQDLISKYP